MFAWPVGKIELFSGINTSQKFSKSDIQFSSDSVCKNGEIGRFNRSLLKD